MHNDARGVSAGCLEFYLCTSWTATERDLACLGKKMHFIYKWHKKMKPKQRNAL
jgi:hypothetical protein